MRGRRSGRAARRSSSSARVRRLPRWARAGAAERGSTRVPAVARQYPCAGSSAGKVCETPQIAAIVIIHLHSWCLAAITCPEGERAISASSAPRPCSPTARWCLVRWRHRNRYGGRTAGAAAEAPARLWHGVPAAPCRYGSPMARRACRGDAKCALLSRSAAIAAPSMWSR